MKRPEAMLHLFHFCKKRHQDLYLRIKSFKTRFSIRFFFNKIEYVDLQKIYYEVILIFMQLLA